MYITKGPGKKARTHVQSYQPREKGKDPRARLQAMGKGKDPDTNLMWPSGKGKDPRTKALVGAEEAMEAYTLGAQRDNWMPQAERHSASTSTFSFFTHSQAKAACDALTQLQRME